MLQTLGLKMKKHQLLLGILVTLIVILFSTNATDHSPHNYQISKIDVCTVLGQSTSWPGLPLNSSDENTSYFKEVASFNSQSPAHFIRLNQFLLCTFKSLFNEQNIEKYCLLETRAFRIFFGVLFRVVISPNAP